MKANANQVYKYESMHLCHKCVFILNHAAINCISKKIYMIKISVYGNANQKKNDFTIFPLAFRGKTMENTT